MRWFFSIILSRYPQLYLPSPWPWNALDSFECHVVRVSKCQFTWQPSRVFIHRWHLGKWAFYGFIFSFLSLGHFISSFINLFLHLSAVILFLTEANKAIRKLMLCLNKITVSPKVPDWCLLTSQLSDPQIRAVRRESCWWKSLALFLSHTLSRTHTHTDVVHVLTYLWGPFIHAWVWTYKVKTVKMSSQWRCDT